MRLLDDDRVLWTPDDHARMWGCDFRTRRTVESLFGLDPLSPLEPSRLEVREAERETRFAALVPQLLTARTDLLTVQAPQPVDGSVEALFEAQGATVDLLRAVEGDVALTDVTLVGELHGTVCATTVPILLRQYGEVRLRATLAATPHELDGPFSGSRERAAHAALALAAFLLQQEGVRVAQTGILLPKSGTDRDTRLHLRRRKFPSGDIARLDWQIRSGRTDYQPNPHKRLRGWDSFAKLLARRAKELRSSDFSSAERSTPKGVASEYGDGSGACGYPSCFACSAPSENFRDVSRIYRIGFEREPLRELDIFTVDELANYDGVLNFEQEHLREKARLQVRERPLDGSPGELAVNLVNPRPIRSLSRPTRGDIHFDFENDPQWLPDGVSFAAEPGLIYLCGLVGTASQQFRALWAHNHDEEHQLLDDLFAMLERQRVKHPNARAYHYGTHELDQIEAALVRHADDALWHRYEDLLAADRFVNLYDGVVEDAIINGAWSKNLSLKTLELYHTPADEQRTDDETVGSVGSIYAYWDACAARDRDDAGEFQRRLNALKAYNEYDCRSTVRLHEWLFELYDAM